MFGVNCLAYYKHITSLVKQKTAQGGTFMAKHYDASHIQAMTEIDHIRHAPGMYIGTTENPAKLLDEILDNAIDELPYCKEGLTVIADYDNNIYGVLDTGRGIPIGESKTPDGKVLPTPVLIASKLFSSGKFKLEAYDVAAGVHGVGLVAVNALSEWLKIEIWRDNKHCIYMFRDGQWIEEESFCEDFDTSTKTGTFVSFKPNAKYFESQVIPESRILERLAVIKLYDEYKNKPIKFLIIKNGKQKEVDIPTVLPSFFKTTFQPILDIKFKDPKTKESIEVYVAYDKKEHNFKYGGAVNVIPVNEGTHITYARNQVKKAINQLANKYKRNLEPDDYQYGLRLYVLTKVKERQFTSQSKEKLSTPVRYFNDRFGDKIANQLIKELEANDKLRNLILDKLETYRQFLSSKDIVKQLKSDTKGNKTTRGLADLPNLKDCLSPSTDNTELFIVEGESAGGTVLSARDPNTMGVLLLKGKVINAQSNSLEKVLKNKEIQGLLKALGTGIGKDYDESKLRYKFVSIMTDADPDGGHISCLLITALASLVPELLKTGRVRILNMPLYGVTHKKTKQFIPVWDKEEWLNYDDKEYFKHRFKGLGEMDAKEMKEILARRDDIAIPIVLNDDEIAFLKDLMISPQMKKQLLIEKGILVI